jgi:hypothetical protein
MIMVPTTHILALVKFTIPKTDVVHPKSGLILHYLAEYRPANKIITFTVSLPMYSDMCYLIPNEAMGKIPECEDKEATIREIKVLKDEIQKDKTMLGIQDEIQKNKTMLVIQDEIQKNKTMLFMNLSRTINPTTEKWTLVKDLMDKNKTTLYMNFTNISRLTTKPVPRASQPSLRRKRFLPEIIAIGVGIASTALSAVNLFQMGNLKSEMRGVKEALRALHLATIDNQAQILHLSEGQLKLAKELGDTQIALNKTMELVNQHSKILRNHAEALRTILSQTIYLRTQLNTVTHAIDTHFIHQSMEDILLHKLNLLFIHHRDMPRVVKLVTQAMNLTIDEVNSSIPMVEIITRLLVRQQIDFAPMTVRSSSENGVLIGKMIFTSYFAAPARDQAPFSIYELVPIPFNKGKRRVQLAKMPAYLGIEPKSQQFIRWSKEEATTCQFEVMPACRESPVRRKEFEDDCIYQILTDSTLNDCRIESFPDKVFIRRVGQHWAISTYNSSKCHAVTGENLDEHILIDNEEVTLPEIALITTNDEKSLACDRFIIPKAPTKVGTPINLIYNESVSPSYKALINLQEVLDNETHWVKLPYITSDMQAVIEFISNTPKPVATNDFKIWRDNPISFTTIAIIGALISLIIVLIFYIYNTKKTGRSSNHITISIPSMKELEAREASREA